MEAGNTLVCLRWIRAGARLKRFRFQLACAQDIPDIFFRAGERAAFFQLDGRHGGGKTPGFFA